jgi:hypothetical protein
MAVADFTPTVAEVGALLRARTKDPFGNELGTFKDDTTEDSDDGTRPSETEATEEIANAVEEVAGHIGTLDDDLDVGNCDLAKLRNRAKKLTVLYAALLIELGYFPEQIGTDRSPYDRLKDLYDERKKTLIEDVSECVGGGGGEVVTTPGQLPSSNYPDDTVIGRRTVW